MKLHANPKSSPGKTTEDFPPPLMMRLPRAKSTTKRASRSRANHPMFQFPRKINKGNNETNLEPSSPKVTCIGQVRVKKRQQTPTTTAAAAVRRCRWFGRAKTRWFRRLWMRKFSFYRCDRCRKSEKFEEKLEEPRRIEANRNVELEAGGGEDEFVTESPPRNAFLLTRSKSAPYRSSSLASKILESRREDGEEDGTGMNVVEKNDEEFTYGVDEEENRGDEGSINGVEIEGFEGKAVSVNRCKSVPVTQADKLFTNCSS